MNSPANKKSIWGERYVQILLVAIPVIGGLVAAYWQFVYKPTQINETKEYSGRILDTNTRQPISGAKISIESSGIPQIYYTDSEGIFYLKLSTSDRNIRVRTDAAGYQPFDRNVSVSRTGIEDIRLTPIPIPTVTPIPSPTITVKVTPVVQLTPKPSENPSQTPSNITLKKIEGDGQILELGTWKTFVIKAVDVNDKPLVGVKVAWQTPNCGLNVYVSETNKDGMTSATNMCSGLPLGTYTQTATLVEKNTPTGFTLLDKIILIENSVIFKFQQQ